MTGGYWMDANYTDGTRDNQTLDEGLIPDDIKQNQEMEGFSEYTDLDDPTIGLTAAEEERPLVNMIGHEIISLKDGRKIAKIDDILVDPQKLCLAAVVTSKGRLLSRKVEAISAENIQVWGKDVLIVKQPDVIQLSDELSGYPTWLSVQDQLKGREVVSMNGERIGQVEGVFVVPDGHLSGLQLNKAVAGSKRIPIAAVHSLGKDILIVDLVKLT
jgi:uncharacterized protein YrrD